MFRRQVQAMQGKRGRCTRAAQNTAAIQDAGGVPRRAKHRDVKSDVSEVSNKPFDISKIKVHIVYK